MDLITHTSFWLGIALATTIIILAYLWQRLKRARSEQVETKARLERPLREEPPLLDEKTSIQMIPSPPHGRSEKLAADRRQSIRSLFQRSQIAFDERRGGRHRLLPVEFLEVPPTLSSRDLPRVELESLEERSGQMARLQWQLTSDHLLLTERVIDTLVANRRNLKRDKIPGSWPFNLPTEFPLVSVSAYDDTLASQGLFPWKVTVETDNPSLDEPALLEASEWLGIGIDIAPRRRIHLFGKCQVGTGLSGVVGGVLQSADARYSMTCSHVLSNNCRSAVVRGNPTPESNQPDAALIVDGNPCFPLEGEFSNCNPANDALIQKIIGAKAAVEKRHPEVRRNKGVVLGQMSAFGYNGICFRFPHLQVLPWNSNIARMSRVFDRPFSKEGESGSWVFDVESGEWIGMVVGGVDDYSLCFVAEAGALMNYFENALPEPNGLHTLLQPKYRSQP